MSQRSNVQTPVLASWLLKLFTPPDQAEPISGDLSEEFATMASTLGSGRARRWYWQQCIKSSAHLLAREFHESPPIIAATALGGYILLWCTAHLVGVAIERLSAPSPPAFGADGLGREWPTIRPVARKLSTTPSGRI